MPDGTLHKPVLIEEFLQLATPFSGSWVDCTYGDGGYSNAISAAGADQVYAIDCDPDAVRRGRLRNGAAAITLAQGRFGDFDRLPELREARPFDGVIFDLGVSSMQFDQAERGFSFRLDGPLDMRMQRQGKSAADIVNGADEASLAEIFFRYGEEKSARRIARAVVQSRRRAMIDTTGQLANLVQDCLPRQAERRIHPATRVFQALRIAVNDELVQLVKGLEAAERSLRTGGRLAVISFHSLEDRIVKRFLKGDAGSGNRHMPVRSETVRFDAITKRAVRPSPSEIAANPRSRSAKLRVASRTLARAKPVDAGRVGLPRLAGPGIS